MGTVDAVHPQCRYKKTPNWMLYWKKKTRDEKFLETGMKFSVYFNTLRLQLLIGKDTSNEKK